MTAAASIASESISLLAFIIPVRIDTTDRLWNLGVVLSFIEQKLPGAEVVVVEHDQESQLAALLTRHALVRHLLVKNGGPFRKSDTVNLGALSTDRPYICVYDTDILLSPSAIRQGLEALQRGWRMVLPFNRIFLDVAGSLRERIGTSLRLEGFDRVRQMSGLPGDPELTARFVEGGIFMADRKTFLAEGGLNRKMVSYGWEDSELHKRFTRLGYPILHLLSFNLIHLDHRRGADSRPNDHYDCNRQEFQKVLAMPRARLENYVETELSLTARGRPASLALVRAAQRRKDIFGMRTVWARWTLLRAHSQAHGIGHLASRLFKR